MRFRSSPQCAARQSSARFEGSSTRARPRAGTPAFDRSRSGRLAEARGTGEHANPMSMERSSRSTAPCAGAKHEKRPPVGGLLNDGANSGDRDWRSGPRPAKPGVAKADEAKQHHRPGRGFGDRGDAAAWVHQTTKSATPKSDVVTTWPVMVPPVKPTRDPVKLSSRT